MGATVKNTINSHLLFISVLAAAVPARAGIQASDFTYGVFDGSSGMRTLLVATHGAITDLNVMLEFAKCDGPPVLPTGNNCLATGNSFNDEIMFRLTSPTGTTVNLINAGTYFGGTRGSGRVQLTLDDEAATAVGGPVLAAGTFRPTGLLAAFDGTDMHGNWALTIRDTSAQDPLSYFASSLDISYKVIPEPGSFALFGLALCALLSSGRCWSVARASRQYRLPLQLPNDKKF